MPDDGYDCQECGQRVTGAEFHSYESCILYKVESAANRLTPADRNYVWGVGLELLRLRVKDEAVPPT